MYELLKKKGGYSRKTSRTLVSSLPGAYWYYLGLIGFYHPTSAFLKSMGYFPYLADNRNFNQSKYFALQKTTQHCPEFFLRMII